MFSETVLFDLVVETGKIATTVFWRNKRYADNWYDYQYNQKYWQLGEKYYCIYWKDVLYSPQFS